MHQCLVQVLVTGLKESKVLCTAPKCKFEAQSSAKCLFEHCKTVHNWRDIPCNFDQCNFIAFSSHSNLAHKVKFHSKHRKFTRKEYSCKWKHCISSFRFQSDLKTHLRKVGFSKSYELQVIIFEKHHKYIQYFKTSKEFTKTISQNVLFVHIEVVTMGG